MLKIPVVVENQFSIELHMIPGVHIFFKLQTDPNTSHLISLFSKQLTILNNSYSRGLIKKMVRCWKN